MIRGKQIRVQVYPFPTDLNRSMSRVVESLDHSLLNSPEMEQYNTLMIQEPYSMFKQQPLHFNHPAMVSNHTIYATNDWGPATLISYFHQ